MNLNFLLFPTQKVNEVDSSEYSDEIFWIPVEKSTQEIQFKVKDFHPV